MQLSIFARRFFEVEVRNESDGGVSPATLASALDSLEQTPDVVVHDWSGATPDVLRAELASLIGAHGSECSLADLMDDSRVT